MGVSNIRELIWDRRVHVSVNLSMSDVDPIGESSFYGICLMSTGKDGGYISISFSDLAMAWKLRNPDGDINEYRRYLEDAFADVLIHSPKA